MPSCWRRSKRWCSGCLGDATEVVFNLLEVGVLSKDEADSRNDFDDLFDFTEVFERNYPWGGRSLA